MLGYMNKIDIKFLLPFILLFMQGCAAVVAGGATSAVAVAYDPRTTGTIVDDQAIELKAATAFLNDQAINESAHINVTSYNNVVLLTGETPTTELRDRVVQIVRDIPKVKNVYNELIIAAPSSLVSRSSDSLITSKVKTRLLTTENFDGTKVKVVTESGIVYLMGIISRDEADVATNATRQVGGVQKVVKLFQYTD